MAEVWTVLRILEWTTGYFREQGIESGRLDAELLLANVLDLDRVGLYLHFDRPLNREELDAYRQLVKRRAEREPVAYILGETEFWSLTFRVTPNVLVPRPDTEILVEESLKYCPGACRILDIGLGSGAIAVALAHENREAFVAGIDISPAAVVLAQENANRNDVADRVDFSVADLADFSGGPYDLIVSNPPYIPHGDLAGLMPDVRNYEPVEALDGGPDGLGAYRSILRRAPEQLTENGWLLVEIGVGQAEDVARLFTGAGFTDIEIRNDYGGIPRVIAGRKES